MKPPARAPASNGPKHGRVLPLAMRGVRRPSSSCWPRRQLIWLKLTMLPLAPETVIRDMQLWGKGLAMPPGRQACRREAGEVGREAS